MRRSGRLVLVSLALLTPALAAQEPDTGPAIQGFVFGDVLFTRADGNADDGFKLGQIVAHANATLSEHVLFFGELSITARNTGYSVGMERAILRYDFNDAVKLSVGRFHTPISYWNTAFHHGLWLQGSVARPRAVTFGTRFIPVHFVGLMAEGQFPNTPLHYAAGVGNGRGENVAAAGDGGDVNRDRAVILSASVRPASLLGFRVGGGLYFDQVPNSTGPESNERIVSGHIVWDRGMLDVVAEYIDVSHEPVGGGASIGSSAYYIHAGVRLPGEWSDVTPYGRWEEMNVELSDPVFGGPLQDYEAIVAGVRYDLDASAAIRAEYRNEKSVGGPRTDALFLQASFAISVPGG